jgi:hypothetical protein
LFYLAQQIHFSLSQDIHGININLLLGSNAQWYAKIFSFFSLLLSVWHAWMVVFVNTCVGEWDTSSSTSSWWSLQFFEMSNKMKKSFVFFVLVLMNSAKSRRLHLTSGLSCFSSSSFYLLISIFLFLAEIRWPKYIFDAHTLTHTDLLCTFINLCAHVHRNQHERFLKVSLEV